MGIFSKLQSLNSVKVGISYPSDEFIFEIVEDVKLQALAYLF